MQLDNVLYEVRGPMALSPFAAARQVASRPTPSGETTPIAVMAAWGTVRVGASRDPAGTLAGRAPGPTFRDGGYGSGNDAWAWTVYSTRPA